MIQIHCDKMTSQEVMAGIYIVGNQPRACSANWSDQTSGRDRN